jgi:hypothetical protein
MRTRLERSSPEQRSITRIHGALLIATDLIPAGGRNLRERAVAGDQPSHSQCRPIQSMFAITGLRASPDRTRLPHIGGAATGAVAIELSRARGKPRVVRSVFPQNLTARLLDSRFRHRERYRIVDRSLDRIADRRRVSGPGETYRKQIRAERVVELRRYRRAAGTRRAAGRVSTSAGFRRSGR